MEYIKHKIQESGHIDLWEKMGGGRTHKKVIAPNQTVPDYPEIKEDENFSKYRTKKNADAYEVKLKELEPTPKELAEREEKRLLQEKRKQVKEELKASKPPQSNPELSARIEKLEFVLGITDNYTE